MGEGKGEGFFFYNISHQKSQISHRFPKSIKVPKGQSVKALKNWGSEGQKLQKRGRAIVPKQKDWRLTKKRYRAKTLKCWRTEEPCHPMKPPPQDTNKKADLTKGSSFGSSAMLILIQYPPLSVPFLRRVWLCRENNYLKIKNLIICVNWLELLRSS